MNSTLERITQRRGVRQFVKFGIVGASGFLVNFLVFTWVHRSAWPYWADFSTGFMAGGVSNYFFNRIWTFRSSGHATKQGAQFLFVSACALGLGLLTSYVLKTVLNFNHDHTVWFISTVAGTIVNFFANKYWTFRDVS
ncbi:MAG: GtrA family protein [Candidatus Eremiobacteraeota bacterium]|nr:GtrA family protein [Candidatus Eremiobacteraeota bacterium]